MKGMSKRYVGVSGFMSRAEVDACLEALPPALTLMVGVLVSEKTLRGERNKHWRRYPRVEEIAGIFSSDPRCLNLIHYASDVRPELAEVARLQDLGGPHCHGFQFNGAYPDEYTLGALAKAWPTYYGSEKRASGATVVLQLRPGKTLTDEWTSSVRALRNCETHILIDGSCGAGRAADPDVLDAWAMTIAGKFGGDVGLVFAGGFCAETLPRYRAVVSTWCASVDAEGKLRDGDEGGVLSLGKAKAWLKANGELP